MKKIIQWIKNNALFLILLFLLLFIPLYPKKPLIDIVNTWVYIRAEDFVVLAVLFFWVAMLFRKKITLKTPLTMPILLFWLVGVISTLHGILIIFPHIANVFPNVAFLSFVRRIEYILLFFIAFAAVKDKKNALPYIVTILTITLIGVSLYGAGQKYMGFPAYLTMNEEFAKGVPIQLSPLSRVPSTFAGHYDLAAYLVLIIPLLTSLLFGIRNIFAKGVILLSIGAGLILLLWTVSRVSFFVLFIGLLVVLILHKKKRLLLALPILGVIFAFLMLTFSPRILDRFNNTLKPIEVLVDAKTGEALGNTQILTPEDVEGKTVMKRNFVSTEDLNAAQNPDRQASISAVPFELVPLPGVVLVPPNESTGENLPQGTGYINLLLSPVIHQTNQFFYIPRQNGEIINTAEVHMLTGKFLVKKAYAYDLSFTTRFQGEWPNAIKAFERNVLFGSGYGSVSLAIDNSYLRMLGEIGLLGFVAFAIIFVTAGIYIKKILPNVTSPLAKSFVIGFIAGGIGIILNATLIDVFEASKVAFYLWMLMGITIGVLHAYQTQGFSFYQSLKKAASSPLAVLVYLGVITFMTFYPMTSNFFVGDDFTWFRWVSAANNDFAQVIQYFTQADGFFYRPGTKIYFQLMYNIFWLNPVVYHFVSLAGHAIVVGLVFLLIRKLFSNYGLAVLASFIFAMLSGYSEAIFWISSVGHVFSVLFVLLSIYLFMFWNEKRNVIFYLLSLLSVLIALSFHELAVIAPLLMLVIKVTISEWSFKDIKAQKFAYMFLFAPIVLYFLVRVFSQSHWTGGDYSYSLINLPFNIIGNTIGYVMLSLLGPMSLPIYNTLRVIARENIVMTIVITLLLGVGLYFFYKFLRPYIKQMDKEDKKILFFGAAFAFVATLPFLDFGNITSRYTYLPSLGFVVLAAFFLIKLYQYLLSNGRDIALAVMSLIIGTFLMFNVIQVQQMHGDWHEAGLKVSRFLTSVEGIYVDYWARENMTLNLVNVPIRTGEAWVFPVGINDALWFVFKNPHMTIKQWSSADQALDTVTNPVFEKVLLIDDGGYVTEPKKKPKETVNE